MKQRARILDNRRCELGEGVLWHPERQQLFWFDIVRKRLLSREGEHKLEWTFDEHHSAAGWIDRDTLLIASETGLWTFGIETGDREMLCPLEADDPTTRSNDGGTDRRGGFWIGTMGKQAEAGKGAIYRYHRGELRCLYPGMSIPNSICFSPDGGRAYFADTPQRTIWSVALDEEGWPSGRPEIFLDLRAAGLNPDGSAVDVEGGLWNAQWGAGRVARYLPDGSLDKVVEAAGLHTSCPCFGGESLKTLFITTACEGIAAPDAHDGLLYCAQMNVAGQREGRVEI